MIQLGKRTTRCALLAAAAMGISATAYAQAPAAEPPAPEAAPPSPDPATAPAPAPAEPVAPPQATPLPPPPPPKATFPSMYGPFLKFNDIFSVRPGFLIQFQGQMLQDPIPQANGDSGEFTRNLFLRRSRFFLLGQIGAPNIQYFILMEASNMGLPVADATGMIVNKQFTGTYALNDVFLDVKLHKNVSIQAGLMLIPFTRQSLQSSSTYLPLDIAAVSATFLNVMQTSTLRDTGFQVKINALKDKFEARVMAMQGIRLPDGPGRAPGKNNPRVAALAQYNIFEPETGYVYNAQYFGKKKVAGISVGVDYQKTEEANPYWGLSSTAHWAIPLKGADPKNGGDEFLGQIQYQHYHAGRLSPAFQTQDTLMGEVGYYNKKSKLGVFAKYEGRFIDSETIIGASPLGGPLFADVNNTNTFGGGFKYFLAEQLANLGLQYQVTQFPNALELPNGQSTRNSASNVQLQLQISY